MNAINIRFLFGTVVSLFLMPAALLSYDPHPGSVLEVEMTNPSAADENLNVLFPWQHVDFSPNITPSQTGSGEVLFCVAGYTNWQSGPWIPPGPGVYTFYVGQRSSWWRIYDAEYDWIHHFGNAYDPIIGEMQVNYTAYTLTVTAGPQWNPVIPNP